MAAVYEDNFGFWELDFPEEHAFFAHVQSKSARAICQRCKRLVRLISTKTICAPCVSALECGAPASMNEYGSHTSDATGPSPSATAVASSPSSVALSEADRSRRWVPQSVPFQPSNGPGSPPCVSSGGQARIRARSRNDGRSSNTGRDLLKAIALGTARCDPELALLQPGGRDATIAAPETIRMERSSRRTVSLSFPQSEEKIVDKERVKGAADKAKGAVKDALGKMTGARRCRSRAKSTRPRVPRTRPSVTSRTPHVKPTTLTSMSPFEGRLRAASFVLPKEETRCKWTKGNQ